MHTQTMEGMLGALKFIKALCHTTPPPPSEHGARDGVPGAGAVVAEASSRADQETQVRRSLVWMPAIMNVAETCLAGCALVRARVCVYKNL